MQKIGMLGLLFATLMGTGCDQSSDTKDRVPTPPAPVATPSPAPTATDRPVVNFPPYDKPVAGFTFEDLLKGPYCTVKMKDDEQTYLLADVLQLSQGPVIYFTLYIPKDGDVVYNGNVVTTNRMDSSNCDLAKLIDADKVPVLLAPIQLYADKEFSGEPTCSFEPGRSPFGEDEFENVYSDYVRIRLKNADLCKGLTQAYLKSAPNVVSLYLAPK